MDIDNTRSDITINLVVDSIASRKAQDSSEAGCQIVYHILSTVVAKIECRFPPNLLLFRLDSYW